MGHSSTTSTSDTFVHQIKLHGKRCLKIKYHLSHIYAIVYTRANQDTDRAQIRGYKMNSVTTRPLN